MGFASTGRNVRYCLLGAKLPSQPLTEVTLHANHPAHIWEAIWMPVALVAPKCAGDWVQPKVNSTNWRESGGILPCTPNKKIHIFQACVVSKLLYCLHTMWLNKAELRKIDGFQAKCLRSILHIPRPYISRLSNAAVLQRNHCRRLSAILKFRQLCLFQSIAVLPDDDVRRRCIFQPSSFILQNLSAPRRQGRPKQIWASEVYRMVVEIAEGFDMLGDLLRDAAQWRSKVRAFCFLPLSLPMCHRTRGE